MNPLDGQAGADMEAKDDDGKTALMHAERKGHAEIVEMLKKWEIKE